MQYDIIGDIHGQADKLEALLTKLGYNHKDRAWRHPSRKAIFVGDFIDRGPKGVEVVNIVRDMVDADSARAVLGNHELNAIAWHTPNAAKPGDYLRPRFEAPWGDKNRHQHQAFLAQVEANAPLHRSIVDWFLTLPLWLDLPELRVVHACWHQAYIDWLAPQLREGHFLTPELMVAATQEPADKAEKDQPGPTIFKAVEAVTKGIELQLPPSVTFVDKDGIARNRVRARWWDAEATTYRAIANMSAVERQALPDTAIPAHLQVNYSSRKPVFFGHYWMSGVPDTMSPYAACVDYSAGKDGPLVAYRYDGELPLSAKNFVWATA
jgi:hypothetical protein